MQVVICRDATIATDYVVALLTEQIRACPNSVLGLATGGTMEAVYTGLRQAHTAGLSFEDVRTFNLDEYAGLGPDHPQSYAYYMAHHLFDHVDIAKTHVPLGQGDPACAARNYEDILAKHGPIDLQLLGIGRNGHIGFNEPCSSPTSRTHVQELTRDTLAANARFFSQTDVQPTSAITMGTKTICEARKIVLLATGRGKSKAVAAMVDGPVSVTCPASILRNHADTVVVLDEAAASELDPSSFR